MKKRVQPISTNDVRTMSAVYRAGIVGCGFIASEHARAWASVPGVNIVAAAEIVPDTLGTFCDRFGIAGRYTDYRDMLRREGLDLVSICTWLGTHAAVTLAAVAAGARGVLCEKAMAPNLAQADAMLAACDMHCVKLCINHQRRMLPLYCKARQLITDGAIGQPLCLTRQTTGGLMNNGSHMVDVMRFMLGDPPVEWVLAQVNRKTDRHERGGRIEDFVSATIVFQGGVRAMLEVDTPAPAMRESTLIVGAEGMLEASDHALRITNREGAGWRDIAVAPRENGLDMVGMCKGLVHWTEGGPEPATSARLNRGSFEILMMIYESARRREPVKPPITCTESPLETGIADGTFKVEQSGAYDIRSEQALEIAARQ